VKVKCVAQEHNTMPPTRTRTQTARSGDERTNHEATAPPREERRTGIMVQLVQCFVQLRDTMATESFRIESNRLRVNSFLIPLSKLEHLLAITIHLFVKLHQHDNLVLDRIKQVVLMDQVEHITVAKSAKKQENTNSK